MRPVEGRRSGPKSIFAYSLDLATNLTPPVVWTPEATNASPTVNLSFTNQDNLPQAFYRLRYIP